MCTIVNLKEVKSKVIGYKVIRINTKSKKLKSQFVNTKIELNKVNLAKKIKGCNKHSLNNYISGDNVGFQIYKRKRDAIAWMKISNIESLNFNDKFVIVKVSGIAIAKCEFMTPLIFGDNEYHGEGYLIDYMSVVKVYK